MNFSYKEKTVKDKTVDEAVKQAQILLRDKDPRIHMCTDVLTRERLSLTDKITLEKMSHLVESLVEESFYYAVV